MFHERVTVDKWAWLKVLTLDCYCSLEYLPCKLFQILDGVIVLFLAVLPTTVAKPNYKCCILILADYSYITIGVHSIKLVLASDPSWLTIQ